MPDLEALADEAAGDSVTADRLRGDEKYFPDCRPHLQTGQQPEHLILLTTSGDTLVGYNEERKSTNKGSLRFRASNGGVVVLTRNSLLGVVDRDVVEIPYATVHAVASLDDDVVVHAGGMHYHLYVAKSADWNEVQAGVGFLRGVVRGAHA